MVGSHVLVTGLEFPILSKTPDIAAAVLGVAAVLFAIRLLVLRWRARSPRVQLSSVIQAIPEDEAASDDEDGSDGSGREIEAPWVESLLREQLAALRLTTTEALPEASSGAPMMEIVEGIGEGIGDKSTLGNALGKLYRAVAPEAAYEVSATVRPLTDRGGTISVQVVDRTRRAPTQVYAGESETSWTEAARKAAAGVAGALYPQVADKHKGPWTHWRRPVPSTLVTLVDEARLYEEANCLDQAMGAYHAALDQNPLNPHLRIKIAMLQERLELDLSAWATYRAIADETHRDSWKGADRRVRLLALYRLAILLGNERLASHWLAQRGDDAPDSQDRKELIDALAGDPHMNRDPWWRRRPSLASLLPAFRFTNASAERLLDRLRSSSQGEEDADSPGKWVAQRLEQLDGALGKAKTGEGREGEERIAGEVRRIFQAISLARLEQLDARLRRKPPWRPWRSREWWPYRPGLRRALQRREFSLSAIRTSKLLARIRIVASAKGQPTAYGCDSADPVTKEQDRLLSGWPFWPSRRRNPARWLRPRLRLANRRDDAWQFHYNAACAVSTVVRDEVNLNRETRTAREAALIESGLKQLEEYVHRAGSDQVRAQADWVGREDDDLLALRETNEYARWARHHLPHLPPGENGKTLSRVDATRMAATIGQVGAQTFSACWHRRAEADEAGARLNAIWWDQEQKAWEALRRVFCDHGNWKARYEGIITLEECLRDGGATASISVVYRPIDGSSSGCLDRLLKGLSDELDGEWVPPVSLTELCEWAEERVESARAEYERAEAQRQPMRRSPLQRREGLRAKRIWGALGDVLETELGRKINANSSPSEESRARLATIANELQGNNLPGSYG